MHVIIGTRVLGSVVMQTNIYDIEYEAILLIFLSTIW